MTHGEDGLHLALPPFILGAAHANDEKPDAILVISGPDVALYGQPVKLEPRDRELLRVLALSPGQWLSDGHLSRTAWDAYNPSGGGGVKGAVYRIRKALRAAAAATSAVERAPASTLIRTDRKAVGRPTRYLLDLDESQVRASRQ